MQVSLTTRPNRYTAYYHAPTNSPMGPNGKPDPENIGIAVGI